MKKRVTPEWIHDLAPNEVFVFGSNLGGMHGGGAARIAYRCFGAKMGVGVGLQGQSYAIPTMQGGPETIRPYVDEFIDFARQHLDIYKEDEHALPPIIKALETRPGTGEDLLILALTSLYDWPRSCALDVLDAWGIEHISPEIKAALLNALNLAQHTLLTLRIKSLLDNKVFDLEGVIKIMALE